MKYKYKSALDECDKREELMGFILFFLLNNSLKTNIIRASGQEIACFNSYKEINQHIIYCVGNSNLAQDFCNSMPVNNHSVPSLHVRTCRF